MPCVESVVYQDEFVHVVTVETERFDAPQARDIFALGEGEFYWNFLYVEGSVAGFEFHLSDAATALHMKLAFT